MDRDTKNPGNRRKGNKLSAGKGRLAGGTNCACAHPPREQPEPKTYKTPWLARLTKDNDPEK